jgi:uncharacterized protein (DUF1501 family)
VLPRGAGGVTDPTQLTSPDGDLEDNPLAVQLQTVARIIGGRTTLGLNRQIFMVGLGAFDHHSDQLADHNYRLRQVDHALGYFDQVLSTLGGSDLRNQVTSFTAAEFGRTFSSNGSGTDHGFGAHHFVHGGAVRGGDILSAFPPLGTRHALDIGGNDGKGSLLALTSVDQLGATLGRWFGLSDSTLLDVFPNLHRFNSSARNLGFMRP